MHQLRVLDLIQILLKAQERSTEKFARKSS